MTSSARRRPRSLLWPIAGVLVVGIALFHPVDFGVGQVLGNELAARVVSVLLTAAVMTAVIYYLFIRRIHKVNDVLEQVVAGDLDGQLPVNARGEIGLLIDNVDRMVGRLRLNYDELKQNTELRQRMVANVSHELRTPLTSIQGYLETALRAAYEDPELDKNLKICHRESKKLGRLIQDLFQLSKLDTQQLEFQFEPVSLTELADQVSLAFEQRMEDKEIHFETRLPDDELEVRADGNRLGQVIQNLLGNASVFTPPGGRVLLSCERSGERALVKVADTGIGIPDQDLPHIFESFFHLEKSRTRNLGGTGLGLAICKAIVDAHGGQIRVESTVGEGTTFIVDLALQAD